MGKIKYLALGIMISVAFGSAFCTRAFADQTDLPCQGVSDNPDPSGSGNNAQIQNNNNNKSNQAPQQNSQQNSNNSTTAKPAE